MAAAAAGVAAGVVVNCSGCDATLGLGVKGQGKQFIFDNGIDIRLHTFPTHSSEVPVIHLMVKCGDDGMPIEAGELGNRRMLEPARSRWTDGKCLPCNACRMPPSPVGAGQSHQPAGHDDTIIDGFRWKFIGIYSTPLHDALTKPLSELAWDYARSCMFARTNPMADGRTLSVKDRKGGGVPDNAESFDKHHA
jgi:hypothetical protein